MEPPPPPQSPLPQPLPTQRPLTHQGPPPPWRQGPPAEPRDLGWRFGAIVAIGAVVVDLALRRPPWNNVAASIAVVAIAAGILASGRIRSLSSKVTVGLAAVLGLFLWVRTAPPLVVFNLLGALALGWYAVVHGQGRSMWDSSPLRLAQRAADTLLLSLESLIDGFVELGARRRRAKASGTLGGDTTAGLVRGAVIAVPIVIVLGLLLASADAVFASFFDLGLDIDVASLFGHVALLALGAYGMIVLLRLAGRDMSTSEGPSPYPLGRIEVLVVLVSLNVLFAGFAVAQLIAVTGSADDVLEKAGLSVKDYARQGFFQLLWVAGITLVVLLSLHAMSRHLESEKRRPVMIAELVSVALTLLIVWVAFRRLSFYIDDGGQTPLRFYSSVFSLWIGVVFLLLAARILGVGDRSSWFTTALGLSGVVFLIGLNLANPEAIIVNNNLDRGDATILFHMDKFSADGNLVLLDGLDQLPADVGTEALDRICGSHDARVSADRRADGFRRLRYNRAEDAFDDRVAELCAP